MYKIKIYIKYVKEKALFVQKYFNQKSKHIKNESFILTRKSYIWYPK